LAYNQSEIYAVSEGLPDAPWVGMVKVCIKRRSRDPGVLTTTEEEAAKILSRHTMFPKALSVNEGGSLNRTFMLIERFPTTLHHYMQHMFSQR
jgi:hypothetical protein